MNRKRMDAQALAENLPPPSPTFAADTMAQLRALAAKEEIPMKRKVFSSILAVALVLALLCATALAAYTLTRSERASAISQARAALSQKYGLTPETIGLFYAESAQQDGTWTIVFRADGICPPLLGDYTVILAPGKDPQASWTHDDANPALWQSGSLDAPVWGQPQLLQALTDKAAADAAIARMDLSKISAATPAAPTPSPAPLQEGESRWMGQILREAAPGPGNLTQEQALALAKQALMEDAALTMEVLNTAEVTPTYYTRDTGNPIWGFQLYLVNNGIVMDCGVMVDAVTGEILLTNVVTGGNG